jgi:hypothetical protein
MTDSPHELVMRWKGAQTEALLDPTLYLDIEGAIRSSKTTIGLWKVLNDCLAHPGARWLISRWKDNDAAMLLKPLWLKLLTDAGVEFLYYPDEHRYELIIRDDDDEEIGRSWVYLFGLRASEDAARYSKFRGLSLSGVYVDQAEEIPEDFFKELQGRLSLVGFPKQLVLTPNPPGEDHWIAKTFPEDNSSLNHKLIRLSLYDNAHNLDPQYILQIEAAYPPGHPMRRRLIFGRRGLAVVGKPVYGSDSRGPGYFDRDRMAVPTALVPAVPLIECIDFGHHHPCILWLQFLPTGWLHVLGGVMGEDLFIEDFAPILMQHRAQWFPDRGELWACCDPAGSHQNSQGTAKNGVDVLRDNGIFPQWIGNSNAPEVRNYAIETVGGYMRRDRFRIDPKRWQVVGRTKAGWSAFMLDGLETGYIWDERPRRSSGGKLITVPLKDGFYEHGQNCLEYGVLNFGPAQPSKIDVAKLERQALRRAQRDDDPDDARRYRATSGLGGY